MGTRECTSDDTQKRVVCDKGRAQEDVCVPKRMSVREYDECGSHLLLTCIMLLLSCIHCILVFRQIRNLSNTRLLLKW